VAGAALGSGNLNDIGDLELRKRGRSRR